MVFGVDAHQNVIKSFEAEAPISKEHLISLADQL
jgi:hypothetical protein